MKLELKHLLGYLPHELKLYNHDNPKLEISVIGFEKDSLLITENDNKYYSAFGAFKPILRPLSDLTKEIEVNGEKFVPFNRIDLSMHELKQLYSNLILPTKLEFWQVDKLLEWHFDIYGLIPESAIDINTLK